MKYQLVSLTACASNLQHSTCTYVLYNLTHTFPLTKADITKVDNEIQPQSTCNCLSVLRLYRLQRPNDCQMFNQSNVYFVAAVGYTGARKGRNKEDSCLVVQDSAVQMADLHEEVVSICMYPNCYRYSLCQFFPFCRSGVLKCYFFLKQTGHCVSTKSH